MALLHQSDCLTERIVTRVELLAPELIDTVSCEKPRKIFGSLLPHIEKPVQGVQYQVYTLGPKSFIISVHSP
jgi:hypothetical protein